MKQEELKNGITVCHDKYKRNYTIIETNARFKDSVKGWVDCVIYKPLYNNEYNMFCRETKSFLNEFSIITN